MNCNQYSGLTGVLYLNMIDELTFDVCSGPQKLDTTLRDCFLKTLWDTDATDFTEFRGKTVIKRLLSVVSAKSVYEKEGNNDLHLTLFPHSLSSRLSSYLVHPLP